MEMNKARSLKFKNEESLTFNELSPMEMLACSIALVEGRLEKRSLCQETFTSYQWVNSTCILPHEIYRIRPTF